MSGTRCFVGIELADDVRDALIAAGEALRDADPSWRSEKWVAAHNLHVTLKFLGTLEETCLQELSDALAGAMAELPATTLVLTDMHAVPNTRRATMVWASFADASGVADRIARTADEVAGAFGVAPETRPFRGHATLVRTRRPRGLRAEALASAQVALGAPRPMSVASATLFASTLTRSGPVYETLVSLPFSRG